MLWCEQFHQNRPTHPRLLWHSPQPILSRHQALPKCPIHVIRAKKRYKDIEEVHRNDGEGGHRNLVQHHLFESEKLALAAGKRSPGITSL